MHCTCSNPQTGRYSLVHAAGRLAGLQATTSSEGVGACGSGNGSGLGRVVGQAGKLQSGPVRPTALPSGQSIASAGHATI